MAQKNKSGPAVTGQEIVITHVFAAPRATVFKAWTDPRQLAQWWGPRGFTNPVCEWDARPGRAIHVVMRAPNGADFPMGGEFREVTAPERLVFTSGALDERGVMLFELLHTVTFLERNSQTKLTIQTRVLRTTAGADKSIGGYKAGMTQSLERLAGLVVNTAGREIVISRVFDAPRELVWQAWTDPEHLQRWFGPKGFTMSTCSMDLRPGGVFHYGMKSPDGHEMWGKWTFQEIVPPEKLVVIASFSDAQGGVTRHPLSATWPLQTLSTTTFTEHAGKTTLTLRWAPDNATEAERQTFDSSHASMTKGWGGTMEQLEAYLIATQKKSRP